MPDRPFVVLVCGSRDWTDTGIIRECLESIAIQHDNNVRVIHGDARGADHGADVVARLLSLSVERFPADWRTHGKRAGVLRNVAMLDCGPDAVLAFQRNGSRGTQHTIDEARRRGIPVEVYESA
jgi:hypothetical protein